MDAATARFVEDVAKLAPETLAAVFDHVLRLRRQGGREASRALRLSASEQRTLDQAVRAALLPRAAELAAHRAGLHSDALSAVVIGARAVRRPSSLSQEQYTLLTAPFTTVDVVVPSHRAND